MRLDFSNIGRGLSAIADAKKARDLARESARYGVTEGAYGEDLQQNIQQLEGLKAQDPEQAPAYDEAIKELQRRAGLTAPDFSVASGRENFDTREAATRAARPMRAEGLARVYEQYGDVDRAEELRERADTGRMRDIQFRQAQLGLESAERTAAAQKRIDDFDAWRSENPNITYQELKDAARTQFKLTDDQLLGVVANMSGLQEGELKIWKNEVQDLIKGKSLDQMVEIYNTDERFDPNTDLQINRRGGRVSVAVVDKASGRTISTESFESDAAAQAYLRRQALEPDTLADWLLERKKIESGIQLQGAQADYYGRERPDRKPTEADVTSRARFIMDNSDPPITQAEAITQARQQLGLTGGAAPAPTGIELLIQRMDEQRRLEQAARENPQAGLR
jgi:hypothetical protein